MPPVTLLCFLYMGIIIPKTSGIIITKKNIEKSIIPL